MPYPIYDIIPAPGGGFTVAGGGDGSLPLPVAGARRIDSVSGDVAYRGDAVDPGTAESAPFWRIRRIRLEMSTQTVITEWANGSNGFTAKWSDRTTYFYSTVNPTN